MRSNLMQLEQFTTLTVRVGDFIIHTGQGRHRRVVDLRCTGNLGKTLIFDDGSTYHLAAGDSISGYRLNRVGPR
ncbi:hypothetical protein [Streptantibioticus ferralitis]|uniref:Uncharacterized protein n=1 Tax=Streptantibioticus ferralitis TaxID=236510 RepID=A0ABT5Z3J2_9ACTN|nr:hypothetical protein [Streptantibioticus ferralitis]MDF2258394.1 hypothetical protein [Streptantibioticus ferralitis]